MELSFREFAFYLYIGVFVISLIFLILTFNIIFIGNSTLNTFSLGLPSVGNWNDWIFIVSLFLTGVFGYYSYQWISDDRFFMENINAGSKSGFLKNLRRLEKIARNHGMLYSQLLAEKKNDWKIK